MAANKKLERGSPLQFTSPSGIVSGQAVVLRGTTGQSYNGKPVGLAMVANADYNSTSGLCSFDLEGAFELSVLAESAESPAVNSAVVPGDWIYANVNSGTFDATTGMFYGFTLDKNQSGIPYGVALDSITAGATATIRVRLKETQ